MDSTSFDGFEESSFEERAHGGPRRDCRIVEILRWRSSPLVSITWRARVPRTETRTIKPNEETETKYFTKMHSLENSLKSLKVEIRGF